MTDACRDCDASILWAVTLRGKRQALDAHPSPMRGTLMLCATDSEQGSRLAVHVTHLADEARSFAERQGLRLYTPHIATCRERHRQRVAA